MYWDTKRRKAYSHDKGSNNIVLCICTPILLILKSCIGIYFYTTTENVDTYGWWFVNFSLS